MPVNRAIGVDCHATVMLNAPLARPLRAESPAGPPVLTTLDPLVVAIVLSSALIHATWNALIKSDTRDRLSSFAVLMTAGGLFAALFLPFLPMPDAAAWPYLIASVVIHNVYYFVLLRAYALGDLSLVYPIARGLAPVLVGLVSGKLVGEVLSLREAAGLGLVSLGILGLAFAGGLPIVRDRWAIVYAVATAITIAAYTIADGLGARASAEPLSYIVWLSFLETPWVLAAALWTRGWLFFRHARREIWKSGAGGIIAATGYGLAIWALAHGGMAHVAALRETSVLFAALFGAYLLKEGFGPRRVVAALTILAGLLAMNLRGG